MSGVERGVGSAGPVEQGDGLAGLVERAEALAALRGAFDGSPGTGGSLVVLSGAVGTGKTALLRAWADRIGADADALVLTATACRAERDLPLGVLEQLVRSPGLPPASAERALAWWDEEASATPGKTDANGTSANGTDANGTGAGQTGAGQAGVGQTGVGGEPVLAASALRGLCEVLRDLLAERPVVVAVDDAHHADAASLQCLLSVVRRLRSARLHVLFTEYAHQKAQNALLSSEFLHEPALRRIRLEPLSKAGVEALLARHLDERTAQDLTPVVHGMSAGHPLLVRALAEDHRAAGGAGEAYGRAVLSFLYRHETPVTQVARAIAALGAHAGPGQVGRLLDVDAASVERAVRQLTVAEVLHEGRLCHPAFAAAVLDGMPPEERRALHGRVADLLHEEGAPATEVAAHLVAADRSDAPWAVPVFQEAAQLALDEDQVETGVDYLRAAHQRCRGAAQRAAVVGALADAEWRLDPAKVLRHLPDPAAMAPQTDPAALAPHTDPAPTAAPTAAPTPTPIPTTPPLPTHLLWHGRVEEGLDAIGTLTGPGPNPAGAPPMNPADLDTPWLWGAYLYPGHVKERLGSGALSPQRSTPPAVTPELQGAGTLMNDLLHGGERDATEAAERALNRYRLGPRTIAVQTAALAALTYRDRPHRAAAWCDGLVAQADERNSPTWRALFTAWRALLHLRQGDPAAAEQRAETALALLGSKGWGAAIGLPLAAAVQAKAALGDVDGAAALLERPVPQAVFQTRTGLHYLAARGRYHLATGCHYAALCDFYACGTRMSSWGVDLPALEPWRLGAAEAYLALGEGLLARQLVDGQLPLPTPDDGRTWGMTLRLRAATSPAPARAELLDEAVAVLRESGDTFELARAVADQAVAVREGGEAERARLLARKAELLARRWGSAPAPATVPEPPERPGPATPDAELTSAERRVAELAAEGFTNREISRKLCVTVSTVEQHLTRIYRKLDVRRLDLQAALG
uniref:MonH n=1 Tax=Streptomyces virginiae TaxID=1961 RepID=Q846X0_STRVG|nr:putative regulatory protein [Streptomyces virginiae]ANZ52465.1 MonH [Streptomyces virginiae]